MTKVEELRETIVACVADSKAILSHQVAEQFVDSLIAAARAEGAEEAKPKIAESTEQLIDWILAMEPPYEGANPQWGRKVLLDLVATAAEQERERILAESRAMGDTEVDDFPTAYLVPVSLLAPATKEDDHGNA